MVNFKGLLASHIALFGAGFFVGKGVNADELAIYRSESNEAWWRRKFILLGATLAGGIFVVVGIQRRTHKLGS
jgi:hypothetical protein